MWRILLGLCLGLLFGLPTASAIRLSKPPTILKWDEATMTQVNTWLESMWQLSNGRYTVDVTTTNPNTAPGRTGTQGDIVFFNSSGSYKLCVNTSATTPTSPTGTTWRCSANAFTAP